MSVAEKRSYSEFNQPEVCEYDESWVLNLLKECDLEEEVSFISDEELDKINLLHDDIIRIENHESSISASNKQTLKTSENGISTHNRHLKNSLTAIDIQKIQLKKAKKFVNKDFLKKDTSSKPGKKLRDFLRL